MSLIRKFAEWRGGYAFAFAAVAIATAVLLPLRAVLSHVEMALLYIPVIGVVARLSSTRASVLSGVLSFLAIDFLFVPPYYTLSVASPRDWVTLSTFLLVAVVYSVQTGHLREREAAAIKRQNELAMVDRLSSLLLRDSSAADMGDRIAHEVVAVVGSSRAALYALGEDGRPELLSEAGAPASGREEIAFAGWVARNDKAIGLRDVPGLPASDRPVFVAADAALEGAVADGVYLPLLTLRGLEGVLYVRPLEDGSAEGFDNSQLRMIVAIENLASAFLERQRLQREAARGEALRQSDLLKNTLLSSVSHELKTPLASITATVTGLLEDDVALDPERLRGELRAVEADLGRLNTSIGDLLDLSRLESESWVPKPEVYDLSEILATVKASLPAEHQARVTFTLPPDLPPVRVDFHQWARALTNLVENAMTYSAGGSPVRVGARVLGGDVITYVEDTGPGIPDAEKAMVFEKFYRGSTSGAVPSGTGLGLTIAKEIVESHGGHLWVEDAPPHGSRFVISVPAPAAEVG
jgi:two-component system, OmpR family, sensor histidine kinase KdpD